MDAEGVGASVAGVSGLATAGSRAGMNDATSSKEGPEVPFSHSWINDFRSCK